MSFVVPLVFVFQSMAWPPEFTPGLVASYQLFISAQHVKLSPATGVWVCPPPAKYMDGECSSGVLKRGFFFPDREFEGRGDVADVPVDEFIGGFYFLPTVSQWAVMPSEVNGKRGYLVVYSL